MSVTSSIYNAASAVKASVDNAVAKYVKPNLGVITKVAFASLAAAIVYSQLGSAETPSPRNYADNSITPDDLTTFFTGGVNYPDCGNYPQCGSNFMDGCYLTHCYSG